MTPAARSGNHERYNQLFVQRYEDMGAPRSEDLEVTQAIGMHFDQRSSYGEVIAGVNLGGEPGHIFFSRRGPRKGQPFPLSLANRLVKQKRGILLELPRRCLYLFFGFARYHLRHGVPFLPRTGSFDRMSLTWRWVKAPSALRPPPWPLPTSGDWVWGQRSHRRGASRSSRVFGQKLQQTAPLWCGAKRPAAGEDGDPYKRRGNVFGRSLREHVPGVVVDLCLDDTVELVPVVTVTSL